MHFFVFLSAFNSIVIAAIACTIVSGNEAYQFAAALGAIVVAIAQSVMWFAFMRLEFRSMKRSEGKNHEVS